MNPGTSTARTLIYHKTPPNHRLVVYYPPSWSCQPLTLPPHSACCQQTSRRRDSVNRENAHPASNWLHPGQRRARSPVGYACAHQSVQATQHNQKHQSFAGLKTHQQIIRFSNCQCSSAPPLHHPGYSLHLFPAW